MVSEGTLDHVEESAGGREEGLKFWVLVSEGAVVHVGESAGGTEEGLKLWVLPGNEFGANEGGDLSAGGEGLGCPEEGR